METEKVYAICKNISHAGGKGSPQGADTGGVSQSLCKPPN